MSTPGGLGKGVRELRPFMPKFMGVGVRAWALVQKQKTKEVKPSASVKCRSISGCGLICCVQASWSRGREEEK